MGTKRAVELSVLIAVAMVLSFIETLIPAFVAIPGVKLGLANIAIIYTLFRMGWREAITLSLLRILLSALLFGSAVTLLYSLVGGALSMLSMLLLRLTGRFGTSGISAVGGVTHNLGQILVASFMFDTNLLLYYFPFLLITGTLAGVVIGLVSAVLIKRI